MEFRWMEGGVQDWRREMKGWGDGARKWVKGEGKKWRDMGSNVGDRRTGEARDDSIEG